MKRSKPTKPDRSWRISILRDKAHYLGQIEAPDRKSAIEKAAEEFNIEQGRRFRLVAEPIK